MSVKTFIFPTFTIAAVKSAFQRLRLLRYCLTVAVVNGSSSIALRQYVVHLDLEAPAAERLELADFVNNEPIFRSVGNVRMILRANLVTYRGPTMVTNTLHAAAILLKDGGDWDWFINLSASDYPLVTQDVVVAGI
ncbi:beta-glucuronosyltransferase GlcAT14B-like [Cucumis melo var. makuwa]|uniref:Beta-glucuronosyltransferase GlcAT14B-like n=1 Tax=Cucumis melo var. makuwa TaxID=1194695 RepID=A0A5A7T4U9_CUCMM|nr:beta-glucuronosyltransferase GlcAT14B-like [Cucumis melo var. makuwa]